MEDFIRIFALFYCFSVCLGLSSNVPALLWTNDNGLSFPSSVAGHAVGGDEFHKNYLEKQTVKSKHNLLVFLQDELSLEDITQNADVYNEHSDGAAFHNLKQIMEMQPSTHVSNLKAAEPVLEKIKKIFDGNVLDLHKPYNVKDLPFSDHTSVIIAHLPPTRGKNIKAALADVDRIIGSVNDQMNELGKPFTALYTAKKRSLPPSERRNTFHGRHLLAAPTEGSFSFWNISGCLYVYAENITFMVKKTDGEKIDKGSYTLPVQSEFDAESKCDGSEATLVVKYPNLKPNGSAVTLDSFDMKMTFTSGANATERQWRGYWRLKSFVISYSGKFNEEAIKAENAEMTNSSIEGIFAPEKYSYHCAYQPALIPKASNVSATAVKTADKPTLQTSLLLQQFQVQLFGTKDQSPKFGQVNDCQGFFTLGIWMALICVLLLVMIFFFGLLLLTSIETQDRFDDPKGKTIQVNVSE